MSFSNKKLSAVYKDILHTDNSNTGISSTIKLIKCGDGDSTALSLSTNNLRVHPASDSTSSVNMRDADGNSLFTVDSTNDLVNGGIGQHTVNTQYLNFAISSDSFLISFSISLIPMAVNFWSLSSKIAITCGSDNE